MNTKINRYLIDLSDNIRRSRNLVAIIEHSKALPTEWKQDTDFIKSTFKLHRIRFTTEINTLSNEQLQTINSAIFILKTKAESEPTTKDEWNEAQEF